VAHARIHGRQFVAEIDGHPREKILRFSFAQLLHRIQAHCAGRVPGIGAAHLLM